MSLTSVYVGMKNDTVGTDSNRRPPILREMLQKMQGAGYLPGTLVAQVIAT